MLDKGKEAQELIFNAKIRELLEQSKFNAKLIGCLENRLGFEDLDGEEPTFPSASSAENSVTIGGILEIIIMQLSKNNRQLSMVIDQISDYLERYKAQNNNLLFSSSDGYIYKYVK